MSIRRLQAIARKEFLHVLRDFRSLAMAVLMPLILLLLFGYALTLDVDRVPLVVWDQGQSPASRELISRFRASRYFSAPRPVATYAELEHAVDSGEALLALVIPVDFAARVAFSERAAVQLIIDGSDASTATLAAGYAETVTRSYSDRLRAEILQRSGMRPPEPPLEVRLRAWFNEDMESRNYLVPGLIAVLMMIVAALLTSLTVAREWERGTMEQLIATPLRPAELVFGKLVPYFALGLLDVLLAYLLGRFLFAVPFRGNLLFLFGTAAVFLAGVLALGLLISIATRSQMLANQLAMVLTFVPAFLLSGLMFSISNMPPAIQAVTYLIPARYFVTLIRAVYLKGVGPRVLWPELLLLTLFTLVMLALAVRAFRKRLPDS